MYRGWMEHPVFRNEPYTRAQAWIWLIEHAAFADNHRLKRGQLCHSYRHLSGVWRWDLSRVARYIKALRKRYMIDTGVDTHTRTAGTLITICNYDTYQAPVTTPDTPTDTGSDSDPHRNRHAPDTTNKERKKKENNSPPDGGERARTREDAPQGKHHRLPDGWQPDADGWQYAAKKGLSRSEAEEEFERFFDYHRAKGSTMVVWNSAWKTWVRNALKFAAQDSHGHNHRAHSELDGPVRPMPKLSVSVDEYAEWLFRVQSFHNSHTRYWQRSAYGPAPGEPGCRAPHEVLEKYGYPYATGDHSEEADKPCTEISSIMRNNEEARRFTDSSEEEAPTDSSEIDGEVITDSTIWKDDDPRVPMAAMGASQ
jgi:hypothetical protein